MTNSLSYSLRRKIWVFVLLVSPIAQAATVVCSGVTATGAVFVALRLDDDHELFRIDATPSTEATWDANRQLFLLIVNAGPEAGTVRVYSAESGALLKELKVGHRSSIDGLASRTVARLDHSGRHLAVLGSRRIEKETRESIEIFDIQAGTKIANLELKGILNRLPVVGWTSDDTKVVVVNNDSAEAVTYDVASGHQVDKSSLLDETDRANLVAREWLFVADHDDVVGVSFGGVIRKFLVGADGVLRAVRPDLILWQGHQPLEWVAMSANSRHVVIPFADLGLNLATSGVGRFMYIDFGVDRPTIRRITSMVGFTSAAIDNSGTRLAVGDFADSVSIISATKGAILKKYRIPGTRLDVLGWIE